jgi:hypothetical protein
MKFWTDELLPNCDFSPVGDCSIAAAAVGGAASLLGAGISAYGATTAAKDQTQAQMAAIAAQQGMFNTAQQNLSPFIQAGTGGISSLQQYLNNPNSTLQQAAGLNNTSNPNSALSQLLALTTPGTQGSNNAQVQALENTPGFQFASQYGTMAADNSLAARGLAGPGGSLAKAVSDYNNGLASTQWQNIVSALQGSLNSGTSNLLNTYGTGAGALQNLVNTGANAAGGLASNAVQTGQGIGSSLTGIGNAQAGAATSIGNSVGSAISGIGTNVSNQNILSLLAGQGGLFGSSGGTGGSIYGQLANGGTASNPLPGLTVQDYGPGAGVMAQYGLGS